MRLTCENGIEIAFCRASEYARSTLKPSQSIKLDHNIELFRCSLEQVQQRKLVVNTLFEHKMIHNAIEAGDPVIAEAAMRRHFQTNHTRYERLFDNVP